MDRERLELTARIKRLLLLRVVILFFFLGATGLSHFVKEGAGTGLFLSLQMPLIAAFIVSIGSALILPWITSLSLFARIQVYFDVILITSIVFITGGIESPFPLLYNLAIVNGAIFLFYRGAIVTAGLSSIGYASLLLWTHYGLFGSAGSSPGQLIMALALNIPTFFIIAFLAGYLSTSVNQTKKLLTEKENEYKNLEALKGALIERVGSGVAITDLNGSINYFNRQAQELTALSADSVKGKHLTEIFPALSYNFNGDLEAQPVAVGEFSLSDSGRPDKQLRLTVAPLSDPAKGPIGFVSIFDDITKQKDLEARVRLEDEMRKARERELIQQSEGTLANGGFKFDGVIGHGGGMDKIYQLIQKVAGTNTNVLITGESGTGKELVARAIHFNGPRRERPFVPVNSGAIPENLIESELFGHVRGAFTGAISDRSGLFKQADKGTLFLDEIGELPLHLQVKLLRVLQERAFIPVGGSKRIAVDVRVISASNRDLRKEMEEGRFREDLFYRLNVVQLALPPLRNRKEDIPLLAQQFIKKFAGNQEKQVEEISTAALMFLMAYTYPGNIRELENMIEHAVAVANTNLLTEHDLPQHIRGICLPDEVKLMGQAIPAEKESFFSKKISLDDELATHEKSLLLEALRKTNGVQKKAAEVLGINYRSFRHRLEKYGLLSLRNQRLSEEDG